MAERAFQLRDVHRLGLDRMEDVEADLDQLGNHRADVSAGMKEDGSDASSGARNRVRTNAARSNYVWCPCATKAWERRINVGYIVKPFDGTLRVIKPVR